VESAAKRSNSRIVRVSGLRAEKIGRGRFMLQRGGEDQSVKNTRRVAPFERREKQSRWKEAPGVPVLRIFGGGEGKNERGRKKKGTSSQVQWKKT
jgi:hypothetical protein